MKHSKPTGIAVLIGFLLLFYLPPVSADIIPGVVENALQGLFPGRLPDEYLQRTLFWLLMFTVLFFAANFVFKDKDNPKRFNNIRVAIAMIVAVIAAIGVPATILSKIFTSWGWASGLLVLGVPVLGILYISHMMPRDEPNARFGNGVRAVMFLLAIVLISATLDALNGFAVANPRDFSLSDLGQILIFFFFIMAIINGVRAIFGGNYGTASSGLNLGGTPAATPAGAATTPATPTTPTTPTAPTPPAPPAYPVHLRNIVNNIGLALNQYRDTLNAYITAGNNILAQNAMGPPPTAADWNLLWQQNNNLLAIQGTLDNLFNQLQGDPGFPNFNAPADVAAMAQCINRRTLYYRAYTDYLIDFTNRFNNFTVPGIAPTIP